MPNREDLLYEIVNIEPNEIYEITVRIGDAHEGDHNVGGDCPYKTPPREDDPEWGSELGLGSEIIGKTLYVDSATQNTNPQSNWVSVWLSINGELIEPKEGRNKMEVDQGEVVFFNQTVLFI